MAEVHAAAWLRSHGEPTAVVGSGRHDGGIDVESIEYVAQVKNWASNIGAPAVRQIYGVAQSRNKRAIFFTAVGYTADALAFADQVGMPLFLLNGTPKNTAARVFLGPH
jgi:restriction endonuclease Mrr